LENKINNEDHEVCQAILAEEIPNAVRLHPMSDKVNLLIVSGTASRRIYTSNLMQFYGIRTLQIIFFTKPSKIIP
jgi:hypothetical protein